MKLGRRPGAFVAFVDSFTEETILKVECDGDGIDLISYHLYDSRGELVSDSEGPQSFPAGHDVSSSDGELLLHVPEGRADALHYRLYSLKGSLLTCSDGTRTQIFGGLRLEGNKHLSGRPPDSSKAVAAKA